MTGWRCGWSIAPRDATAAFNVILGQSTSNITSITQKAALAALKGPQDAVFEMLEEYRTRRDSIHAWLTAHPGISCEKPKGAFYLLPDISRLLSPGGIRTSAEFAQALVESEKVVVVPGEAFAAPGYGVVDAYFNYAALDNLTVYLGVTNIADKRYWEWNSVRSLGVIPAIDRYSAPGRAASAGIKLSFD